MSAAAVGLAECLVLVFTLLGGSGSGSGGPEREPAAAMSPVGRFPVSAAVGLVDAEGGMRVEMECEYGGERGGDYVPVAVGPDGTEAELARWYALPQDTASLTVGTPLRRADIASLEVRTPSGTTVLRLALDSWRAVRVPRGPSTSGWRRRCRSTTATGCRSPRSSPSRPGICRRPG